MVNSLHLKGAMLTAPPFSEDTIIMLATGWNWDTLQATPEKLVRERMLIESVSAEYRAKKIEE